MQNNSQDHRDRPDQKPVSVHEEPNSKPECRGLRSKAHMVDEAAPTEVVKNFVTGVVTDCLKLNVRETPYADGEVLAIVDALSTVTVDMSLSTDDFYKVLTETGIEGFCMRKYIALKK